MEFHSPEMTFLSPEMTVPREVIIVNVHNSKSVSFLSPSCVQWTLTWRCMLHLASLCKLIRVVLNWKTSPRIRGSVIVLRTKKWARTYIKFKQRIYLLRHHQSLLMWHLRCLHHLHLKWKLQHKNMLQAKPLNPKLSPHSAKLSLSRPARATGNQRLYPPCNNSSSSNCISLISLTVLWPRS